MSKQEVRNQTFLRGLETTGREDGLELPAWVTFQNVRVKDGAASVRPGRNLVTTLTSSNTALQFNDASAADYVVVPQYDAVHQLKLRWTMELMFKPASVSGTQTIVGFDHATDWPFRIYLDGTDLHFHFKWVGGGSDDDPYPSLTVAAGTTYVVHIARQKTGAINVYVGTLTGTLSQSLSMSYVTDPDANLLAPGGDMMIASDASANLFVGTIDYFRAFNRTLPSRKWLAMRWPDPKCDYCLWDYTMELGVDLTGGQSGNTGYLLPDRSRYENHGHAIGPPGSVAALCVPTNPVNLIHQRLDTAGKRRLDVIAGKSIFLSEVNG